jgi:hypothetical protein
MLTDYAENRLIDLMRGFGLPSLPTTWQVGLVSAATDSSYTEITGAGYTRQTVERTLTAWAGTQGAGTTLPSTGTSHATSNNEAIDFGTAGDDWGDVVGAILCDEDSPGIVWFYVPFTVPLTVATDDPVSIAAGTLTVTIGLTGGCSDYLANKLVDYVFRDEVYGWPSHTFIGYCNTAASNAGPGTEPSGSYERQAVPAASDQWDNTQGDRSTDDSQGTSGHTSNNNVILFAVPTIDQGAVGWVIIMDSSSLGNLLFWHALASPKSLTAGGDAPQFDVGALEITFN